MDKKSYIIVPDAVLPGAAEGPVVEASYNPVLTYEELEPTIQHSAFGWGALQTVTGAIVGTAKAANAVGTGAVKAAGPVAVKTAVAV